MSCPSGDVPDGPLGTWTQVQARLVLQVDEHDVGHLRARLPWKNETSGAAVGDALLSSQDSVVVVTGARVRSGDRTSNAALVDAEDADLAFDTCVDARRIGVAEKVGGRHSRVAAMVQHADAGAVVHVAGACSVRVAGIDVDALLTSVPYQGGRRFFVPRVFIESIDDVDANGSVWIDGRPSRHARTSNDGDDNDRVEDSGSFVVDVRHAAHKRCGAAGSRRPGRAPTAVDPNHGDDSERNAVVALVHTGARAGGPTTPAPKRARRTRRRLRRRHVGERGQCRRGARSATRRRSPRRAAGRCRLGSRGVGPTTFRGGAAMA